MGQRWAQASRLSQSSWLLPPAYHSGSHRGNLLTGRSSGSELELDFNLNYLLLIEIVIISVMEGECKQPLSPLTLILSHLIILTSLGSLFEEMPK